MHGSTPGASERLLRQNESAKACPHECLLIERLGVRSARGRKVNETNLRRRLADQFPADRSGCGAVKGNPSKLSEIGQQVLDLIVIGLADRLVEAAGPACRGDYVPKADASIGKPGEPFHIGELLQFLLDRAPEEPPELVGRMGIIAACGKGSIARKATENEESSVASSDQRQSIFDAQELTPTARPMKPTDLRVALFSGNYNYVRDGANQALNRLMGYLIRQGVKVRVYSPTVENPAFPATGDLVHIPAIPIPGRSEYRLPIALPARVKRDLAEFNPNVVHVSSPDIVGHRAVTWARRHRIAAVASVHTRFDTYLAYYHLQAFEPLARDIMRRFYHRCEVVMAPAESTAVILRAQRMNRDIALWARGVDREQFNPERRDMEWRRSTGIADDEMVIAFLGRVVMEKGLDVFADAIHAFDSRGFKYRVLVIGEGPARPWFEEQLPNAIFTGQLTGNDLSRALASSDLLLNPSITEAFGNVTLETMACALPVIAAEATGTTNLVRNNVTGMLVDGTEPDEFADALEAYASDPDLRRRHGEAALAIAKTMDWDSINATVIRVYLHAIHKRERLTRMTGR
jgi:phosphatidylinositol alpha 1,6-mannosyltransferase